MYIVIYTNTCISIPLLCRIQPSLPLQILWSYLYKYIYMYTYIYMFTYMVIYIHICKYKYIHMYVRTGSSLAAPLRSFDQILASKKFLPVCYTEILGMYIHIFTYIYIYIQMCVYIYMYTYIYIEM
jgi:hypothetical protein